MLLWRWIHPWRLLAHILAPTGTATGTLPYIPFSYTLTYTPYLFSKKIE